MTTSDSIKKYLCRDGSRPADWKRTSKTKLDGVITRTFFNRKVAAIVTFLELEDGTIIHNGSPIDFPDFNADSKHVFGIVTDPTGEFEGYSLITTPMEYWRSDKCVYDRPTGLEETILSDAEDLNECGTWVFNEPRNDYDSLKTEMESRGLIWDKEFELFVQDGGEE